MVIAFICGLPHPSPRLAGGKAPLEPIARSVVLEVSEHAPMEQHDALATQVSALRGAGFRIAVDDLGTGHAGLGAFTKLSPDFAKLDRTLLAGLDADESRKRVVKAMFALCSELGTPVIAEGVETNAERDSLLAIGADLAQGNLLGTPRKTFERPAF